MKTKLTTGSAKSRILMTIALTVSLMALTSISAHASLASIGSSLLRWLSRADIVAHDLSVTVDVSNKSAHFVDDVTVRSRGGRSVHVLLGADFHLEAVSDPATGEPLGFGPFFNIGGLPFTIYRVDLPPVSSGEEVQLRFEWQVDQSTIRFMNPFIGAQFFYVGHAMVWHPYTPNEGFFTASLKITAPKDLIVFADGEMVAREEHGSWETISYETPMPVNSLGFGVGRFQPLPPIEVGGYHADGWRSLGVARARLGNVWGGTDQMELIHRFAAQAHQYFTDHFGSLPVGRFHVVDFPFDMPAAYTSVYGLVIGGDLRFVGAHDEKNLAHIIAHEVAHQWIGSSVGVRLLGSAWLTEGLGEYLGYLAAETMMTSDDHELLFHERIYTPFVEIVGTRESQAVGRIELIDESFQQLRYKGALLFRSLHRRLGDEHFLALVRQFIQEKQGTVVAGSDFIRFTREYVRSHSDALTDEIGLRFGEVSSFYDRWLKADPQLDYALHVQADPADGHQYHIKVTSVGRSQEPGPVQVRFRLQNGTSHLQLIPVGNEVQVTLADSPWLIEIDPFHWLADVNPENNWWIAPD